MTSYRILDAKLSQRRWDDVAVAVVRQVNEVERTTPSSSTGGQTSGSRKVLNDKVKWER